MEFEINQNFAELSGDDLATYAGNADAAFRAAVEALGEDPTDEQITAAEELSTHLDAVNAETERRATEAAARAERAASLRNRFSADEPVEDEESEEEKTDEDDESDEGEAEVEASVEEKPEPVSAKVKGVVAMSTKIKRPAAPAADRGRVAITAAADVPGFATGTELDDMSKVGQALVNRMKGFGVPSGNGETENLQHFGVAQFRMDFPKELTIDRHSDDMEVLSHAANEKRLSGNSLVAAGGWCAPSETLYDLCTTGETLDGILSIPEVNVARGGIKYTPGPDFSAIYTNTGFLQTEAQAIAGTTKTCYEVPCPAFTEVRLDAIGVCIKAPILTNAAYPELVNRWLTGSMVAHQHKVNASVISRMATLAGTANAVHDFGGTAQSTLANLELLTDRLRQKYKMGLNESMEVVLPFWVKGAIRSDFSLRTGVAIDAVTDELINAHFRARKLNVQFVYGWQELADNAVTEGYPATYEALIYPSGTFVKGTSDVINLNAVYDAASLAVNTYTALFFEQGLLVAKMCAEAMRVTLAVCNAGRTGIANVAECGIGEEV